MTSMVTFFRLKEYFRYLLENISVGADANKWKTKILLSLFAIKFFVLSHVVRATPAPTAIDKNRF